MSEIKPALTVEDWAEAMASGYRRPADAVDYEAALYPHRSAALLLYGEPFGFTWEDVVLVRELATIDADSVAYHEWKRIRDLADRIAALLPPRE